MVGARLKTLSRDCAGNFAMITALTAPVLLCSVVYASNLSTLSKERLELQHQLDAAALAVSAAQYGGEKDKTALEGLALKTLVDNGFEVSELAPEVKIEKDHVRIEASVEVPLMMGGVVGRESSTVASMAEANMHYAEPVEIALVLDTTVSMRLGGRMSALREGANALIDAVEESDTDSHIALVPFSKYINVSKGKPGEKAKPPGDWVDVPDGYKTKRMPRRATANDAECHERMLEGLLANRNDYGDRSVCEAETVPVVAEVESEWQGCVGSRGGAADMEDTDFPAFPGLLNIKPREVSGLDEDLEVRCPSPITPLTDEYDKLRKGVTALEAVGGTYLPNGVNWGRRVLSPGKPFDESKGKYHQIMVIMSDGMNTGDLRTSRGPRTVDEPVPYIARVPDIFTSSPTANADTLMACQLAKDEGIEIYTIAFDIDDTATVQLLADCASEPTHAFTAESNDELVETFRKLDTRLESRVRLVR